ncbi:hypothetical protein DINM_003565 [Dirofilaria immitis]|nr:hypothetical protein [Dirofilaria immitis]
MTPNKAGDYDLKTDLEMPRRKAIEQAAQLQGKEGQLSQRVEWKELLRSAKDDEWKGVILYEDYLASLLMELNRISEAFIEIKGKCEKIEDDSATTKGQKKSLEDLIEKLITSSKPLTLNPTD